MSKNRKPIAARAVVPAVAFPPVADPYEPQAAIDALVLLDNDELDALCKAFKPLIDRLADAGLIARPKVYLP
jgi:hypothetical protein